MPSATDESLAPTYRKFTGVYRVPCTRCCSMSCIPITSLRMGNSKNSWSSQVLPLTPRALPILLEPRLVPLGPLSMLVFAELAAGVEAVLAVEPLPTPLARPLVLLLDARVAASALRFSSSSAFRAAAAFLSCSSTSRLSAASCLACVSSSISAMSWFAPCHDGSRIRR